MHPDLSPAEWRRRLTRRNFLSAGVQGIGTVALSSLLSKDLFAAKPDALGALPGLPHFAPKAKRVICLWQGGGPSHVDLFDHKPTLAKEAGKDIPASIRGDTRLSSMSSGYAKWPAVPAIKPFARYGQSGRELSTLIPHIGSIADEICVVRSLNTEAVNHAPGVTFFMTGSQIPGRPAVGAWLAYGLGTMNQDLPAYVVMTSSDKTKTCGQLFFEHYWSNGFLPGKHQGVRFRGVGEPVPYVANPAGVDRAARRTMLDDLQALNREHFAQLEMQCRDTDQPSAALVKDLKQRGLLDDTLVIWGGEFGRTPFGQNQQGQGYKGRDHFGRAYSWWLAGGGVRKGHVYGETDDFGWNVAKDSVHIHDMQATLLHLCGINHEALTYRYQGRQFRLTDVHGKAVKGILA